MLLVDETPSFPSLLLVFSLYLGPLISEMIYMSFANYNYPFLSVMLFFAQSFCCASSCWLQHSPTNAQNWWWCKSPALLLVPTIIRYSCCLLSWDFPRAPAAEQVADWLRHVWWFSQVCHKGGWRTETSCGNLLTLWRSHDFLLNLKIPSKTRTILFLNLLCCLSSFCDYLNIAWSVAFFVSYRKQSIICWKGRR